MNFRSLGYKKQGERAANFGVEATSFLHLVHVRRVLVVQSSGFIPPWFPGAFSRQSCTVRGVACCFVVHQPVLCSGF